MEKLYKWNIGTFWELVLCTVIIYTCVILFIQILGKRSTSQLNSFDWIITVSVGSVVASTIILKGVSALEGATAVFVLLSMQYLVTKFAYSSEWFLDLVKSTPRLLLFEGEFIDENMKKERITKLEVYAAIRHQGFKNTSEICAVVLETNTELSIIPNTEPEELCLTLHGVCGLPDDIKEKIDNHHKKQEEKREKEPAA